MSHRRDDVRVLVFAPVRRNAELIADRLAGAGLQCDVVHDGEAFERALAAAQDTYGVVLVTARAIYLDAAAVIERFQEREPAWSSLPIIVLTPLHEAPAVPWRNATVLTQPTRARVLVAFVRRALEAREQQHLVARTNVRLRHIAYRDALTGLPNRTALYERIGELQRERRGSEGVFSAIFLDLDSFKSINDRFGHGGGDEALRQVAAHVASAVRATDFVARWGGDEFVVLLVGADGVERLDDTVHRLTQGLHVRLPAAESGSEETVPLSLSVGYVGRITGDESPDDILSEADTKMYAHKRTKDTQRS